MFTDVEAKCHVVEHKKIFCKLLQYFWCDVCQILYLW